MISEEREFQIFRVKGKKEKKSDRQCRQFHIDFFSVSTLSYSATTQKIYENELIENNKYLIGNKQLYKMIVINDDLMMMMIDYDSLVYTTTD